jgi:hypothetical protein
VLAVSSLSTDRVVHATAAPAAVGNGTSIVLQKHARPARKGVKVSESRGSRDGQRLHGACMQVRFCAHTHTHGKVPAHMHAAHKAYPSM